MTIIPERDVYRLVMRSKLPVRPGHTPDLRRGPAPGFGAAKILLESSRARRRLSAGKARQGKIVGLQGVGSGTRFAVSGFAARFAPTTHARPRFPTGWFPVRFPRGKGGAPSGPLVGAAKVAVTGHNAREKTDRNYLTKPDMNNTKNAPGAFPLAGWLIC